MIRSRDQKLLLLIDNRAWTMRLIVILHIFITVLLVQFCHLRDPVVPLRLLSKTIYTVEQSKRSLWDDRALLKLQALSEKFPSCESWNRSLGRLCRFV